MPTRSVDSDPAQRPNELSVLISNLQAGIKELHLPQVGFSQATPENAFSPSMEYETLDADDLAYDGGLEWSLRNIVVVGPPPQDGSIIVQKPSSDSDDLQLDLSPLYPNCHQKIVLRDPHEHDIYHGGVSDIEILQDDQTIREVPNGPVYTGEDSADEESTVPIFIAVSDDQEEIYVNTSAVREDWQENLSALQANGKPRGTDELPAGEQTAKPKELETPEDFYKYVVDQLKKNGFPIERITPEWLFLSYAQRIDGSDFPSNIPLLAICHPSLQTRNDHVDMRYNYPELTLEAHYIIGDFPKLTIDVFQKDGQFVVNANGEEIALGTTPPDSQEGILAVAGYKRGMYTDGELIALRVPKAWLTKFFSDKLLKTAGQNEASPITTTQSWAPAQSYSPFKTATTAFSEAKPYVPPKPYVAPEKPAVPLPEVDRVPKELWPAVLEACKQSGVNTEGLKPTDLRYIRQKVRGVDFPVIIAATDQVLPRAENSFELRVEPSRSDPTGTKIITYMNVIGMTNGTFFPHMFLDELMPVSNGKRLGVVKRNDSSARQSTHVYSTPIEVGPYENGATGTLIIGISQDGEGSNCYTTVGISSQALLPGFEKSFDQTGRHEDYVPLKPKWTEPSGSGSVQVYLSTMAYSRPTPPPIPETPYEIAKKAQATKALEQQESQLQQARKVLADPIAVVKKVEETLNGKRASLSGSLPVSIDISETTASLTFRHFNPKQYETWQRNPTVAGFGNCFDSGSNTSAGQLKVEIHQDNGLVVLRTEIYASGRKVHVEEVNIDPNGSISPAVQAVIGLLRQIVPLTQEVIIQPVEHRTYEGYIPDKPSGTNRREERHDYSSGGYSPVMSSLGGPGGGASKKQHFNSSHERHTAQHKNKEAASTKGKRSHK